MLVGNIPAAFGSWTALQRKEVCRSAITATSQRVAVMDRSYIENQYSLFIGTACLFCLLARFIGQMYRQYVARRGMQDGVFSKIH